MIDKGQDDDDKDLEHKKLETQSLDDLTDDFNLDDELNLDDDLDLDLEHDDMSSSLDDEYHDEFQEDDYTASSSTTEEETSSIIDFLKSYGVVILVAFIFIIFGLKYSWGVIFGSSTSPAPVLPQPTQLKTPSIKPAPELPKQPIQPVKEDKIPVGSTLPNLLDDSNQAPVKGTTIKIENNNSKEDSIDKSPKDIMQDLESLSKSSSNSTINSTGENKIKAVPEPPLLPEIENAKKIKELKSNQESVVVDTAKISGIDNKIDALSQSIKDLETKVNTSSTAELNDNKDISEIKDQIKDLATKLNQVLLYSQGIGKSMGALSDRIKKQEEVIESIASGNVSTPIVDSSNGRDSSQEVNQSKNTNGIILEAVISGRAWLRMTNDKQLSVTIGDNIPGYGKVIAIDPKKGIVTTDTGKVFKY